VGLVGGTSSIDRAIRLAERRLRADRKPSLWSHCFVFQDLAQTPVPHERFELIRERAE